MLMPVPMQLLRRQTKSKVATEFLFFSFFEFSSQ